MRRVDPAATRRRRRWTTRLRRGLLWAGVPIVLAAGAGGALLASRSPGGDSILHGASRGLWEASAALGFRVADIRVEGRETTDRETILDALGARPGTPILAVDPARAKQQLESLPWVRSAVIERRFPDTIYVRLVEREPMALWQHGGRIELIDRSGAVIPVTRLDRFAKLPMVVGEDAASHAAELLAMLASEPALAARVTAAVHVGGRRWNLRIGQHDRRAAPVGRPGGGMDRSCPPRSARAQFCNTTCRRSTCGFPTGLSCASLPSRQRRHRQPRKDARRRKTHDRDRRTADAREAADNLSAKRRAAARRRRPSSAGRPNRRTGRAAAWSRRSISAPPRSAALSPGSRPEQPQVVGIGHQIARGLRNGAIVDLEAAGTSVANAVHAAEEMAGETIQQVVANLSGGFAASRIVKAEIGVAGREIGETELQRVLDQGYRCASRATARSSIRSRSASRSTTAAASATRAACSASGSAST